MVGIKQKRAKWCLIKHNTHVIAVGSFAEEIYFIGDETERNETRGNWNRHFSITDFNIDIPMAKVYWS